jgi:hypothetical protein
MASATWPGHTSGKIAGQLVRIQLDNLGIDYIDRRPA